MFASLEEFAASVSTEAKIDRIIDTAGLDTEECKMANRGRMKLALDQIGIANDARRLMKKGHQSVDEPLTEEQLEEVEDLFWKRYHMSFRPEDDPTDALVSRIAREIDKRKAFTLRDIGSVKPRAVDRRDGQPCSANSTSMHEHAKYDEDVDPTIKSASTYLAKLQT